MLTAFTYPGFLVYLTAHRMGKGTNANRLSKALERYLCQVIAEAKGRKVQGVIITEVKHHEEEMFTPPFYSFLYTLSYDTGTYLADFPAWATPVIDWLSDAAARGKGAQRLADLLRAVPSEA